VKLGVAASLVAGEIVPGDVEIDDGVVTAVGVTPAGRTGLAAPGFIDLQVNGFAGHDFSAADAAGYAEAATAMAATGVTAYQPTFVSLPLDEYPVALATAAEVTRTGGGPRLLGVHLEGPFLSPEYHGAHDPRNIIDPDLDLCRSLLAMGPVTHLTLAPERPGALDLIGELVAHGVTVACGHTDANTAQASAAFDAGARVVTHLFNAQRPFDHRDPGIVGVALARPDVAVTIIPDGVHLAPETMLLVHNGAHGGYAVITDAIAATGRSDGTYRLGNREVRVQNGEARLADGTLAGSVLTMDRAVRNLFDLDITLEDALTAAAESPALVAGRPDLAMLGPNTPADIVVLDDRLEVERTLVAGTEVFSR
jgi:N-acetylglucosamine-6-phosphate deacetylase